MPTKKSLVLLLMLLSVGLIWRVDISKAEKMRVSFLNPAGKTDWFWSMVTDFMQAAADDLDIDLEVLYSDRNHFLTVQQAEKVVNRSYKPHYIITGNEKGNAATIINIAEKAGVKVFLFSNGFVDHDDLEKYGVPRKYYSSWIGQYIPDNFSAGYQIGKFIIEQGLAQGLVDIDGKLNIVAFAGAFATHASTERVRGLEAVAKEYSEKVRVLQIIPGDWSKETAAQKALLMFARYSKRKIGAIWSANDAMALGVMNSAQGYGKVPGKDFFIGGCGWSSDAIIKVSQGSMAMTSGGHFMDGAWALVMLYDYHHGRDFQADPVKSAMHVIDKANADRYLELFGSNDWNKIDFKQFSKVLNPQIMHYDFSLGRILNQLK